MIGLILNKERTHFVVKLIMYLVISANARVGRTPTETEEWTLWNLPKLLVMSQGRIQGARSHAPPTP